MNNNNYELHRALDLITEQTQLLTLKELQLLRFYNLDQEGDFVNFIIYPQSSMVKIKRDIFSTQMITKLNEYPLALLSKNMFFHLDNRAFSSLANALSVKSSSYKDLVSMAEEQNDRGVIDRYYASFADFIAQANKLNVVARIDDTGREVILVNQGSRMNLIPQNWIVSLADEIGGLTLMDYHITKSITSVFYKFRKVIGKNQFCIPNKCNRPHILQVQKPIVVYLGILVKICNAPKSKRLFLAIQCHLCKKGKLHSSCFRL